MLYEWQYIWSQEMRFPWNASNRNHRNQWLVNEGETDGVFSSMSDVLMLSVPCISDNQLKRMSSVYTILKITQFSIIWSINFYYTIAFIWIHGHRIMQRLRFGDIKHIEIRNVPNYFDCRGQCPHTFQIHEWQHNISDPRKVTNVPIFFHLHGSSVPISPKPWQNTVDTLVFIAGTLGCVFIDNETHESGVTKCTTGEAWSAFSWHHSSVFHCQWTHK